MWKNMTIGKKLALGFAVVLCVLGGIVVMAFTGVGGIVTNAQEVIYGNELDGNMTQKEVDHLNWVNKVSALLTDENVTTLNVELDDHQCGFGKWLYSDARKEAEKQIPGLASTLKGIEEPHCKLHESAGHIGECFIQADAELPGLIAAREVDHLNWANAIRDTFLENKEELNVQVDGTQCALGKWLTTAEAKKNYDNGTAEFRKVWDAMAKSHAELHRSAKDITDGYAQIHQGLETLLLNRLLDHKNWAENVSKAIIEGKSDLGVQTDHSKCAYGKFLASEQCAEYTRTFPEFRDAVEESKEPHRKLHESAIQISKALEKGVEGKAEAEKLFQETTLPALAHVGECFHKAITAEKGLTGQQAQAKKIYDEKTTPLLNETLEHMHAMKSAAESALAGMNQANGIYAEHTVPNLHKVQGLLQDAREKVKDNVMTQEAMLGAAQGTKRNVGVVGIIGILAGIVLAFVIARGITSVLKRIINGLTEGSEQVSSAAGQVSSASQSLAEGATEQAAGLEETSSSLEEMSSMTKQNAENAAQANNLSSEARKAADSGSES
ncbi:MAG: CZB domain-containing protein, partial [Pseudodesulfovibrio sp.]|nr:CZB domain-containing protein [Pseudodesulfovibrio sp.]